MEKRLQSLRLPRDLTLGGTKPKKTFAPNLNAARNKDKPKGLGFIKVEDKRKSFHARKDSKSSQKFAVKSERFLQSSGIFSEGIGTDVKKARYERTYSSRDEPNNVMAIPKVKKNEWQVNNKNETKVYDDIMGCESSINDNELLPFVPSVWNESEFRGARAHISNKTEFIAEPKIDLDKLKIVANDIPIEFQNSNRSSDRNPSLALWNLPDSLAGKGLSDDPNVGTLFDYKLTDMLEGQIGRLRIHRSGKIDVMIGYTKYEIAPTLLESLPERVVSIDANKKAEENNAVVIGEIQHRYILNPEWTGLVFDS